MSLESGEWRTHLPEARAFCNALMRSGKRPKDAIVEFGVQPFGDETWPEAHRLIAKAIALRNSKALALDKVPVEALYGSSSLSQ